MRYGMGDVCAAGDTSCLMTGLDVGLPLPNTSTIPSGFTAAQLAPTNPTLTSNQVYIFVGVLAIAGFLLGRK